MKNLRILLLKAEEVLIQLNLVKARIAEEYVKKVVLAQGNNENAKKKKVLAGRAIEEQKAVFNINSFYQDKLFAEPPKKKKKKKADKDESNKKAKPEASPSYWL